MGLLALWDNACETGLSGEFATGLVSIFCLRHELEAYDSRASNYHFGFVSYGNKFYRSFDILPALNGVAFSWDSIDPGEIAEEPELESPS